MRLKAPLDAMVGKQQQRIHRWIVSGGCTSTTSH